MPEISAKGRMMHLFLSPYKLVRVAEISVLFSYEIEWATKNHLVTMTLHLKRLSGGLEKLLAEKIEHDYRVRPARGSTEQSQP
jgi:hypothetical protein